MTCKHGKKWALYLMNYLCHYPLLFDMRFLKTHFNRTWQFTREGKVLFAISLGLGVAAINTGNNLLYLVFSMSLSMIILSGLLSELNLSGLKAEIVYLPQLTVGMDAYAIIKLSNQKRFIRSMAIGIGIKASKNVDTMDSFVVMLKPKHTIEISIHLTGKHRGPFYVSAIHYYTTFPFSLAQVFWCMEK